MRDWRKVKTEDLRDIFATQLAIIEFSKQAAVILAEAGRASARATGDTAEYAVRQWSKVIEDEALKILREPKPEVKLIEAKDGADNERDSDIVKRRKIGLRPGKT